MKKRASWLKTCMATTLALGFLWVLVMPHRADALSWEWFGLFKKKEEKAAIQKESVQPPSYRLKTAMRYNALLGTMRAFRTASPELRDLTAQILTGYKTQTLAELNLASQPSYLKFRETLATTGLQEIKGSMRLAKGTQFKKSLVSLLIVYASDPKVPAATKKKIIAELKEVSLLPYRFRDRHQMLAILYLSRTLPKPERQQFVKTFIEVHKKGKESRVQLVVYQNALKEIEKKQQVERAKKVKAPQAVSPQKQRMPLRPK